MTVSPIYLDHNATTPLSPTVWEAMQQTARQFVGNPASSHRFGREARRRLEQARGRIVEIMGGKTTGMSADRLVFTSGGTEANHLALLGLAGNLPGKVVVSAIEHPSLLGAAELLKQKGFTIQTWPVTASGIIDLQQADRLLSDDVRLVSVMLANNETGVIQPVAEMARLCRKWAPDAKIHCDAVQAIGKIPVDFGRLNIDALTLAPHKFHGPVGIGGLLIGSDVPLEPQMRGGFQQAGLRPGTESVMLSVGFMQAFEEAQQEQSARTERMAQFQLPFEQAILTGFTGATVVGGDVPRLPQTSNIAFPGVDRQALVIALDLAGVACSTGSACASGSSEPSPVLLAMGLSEELVASSLRFSWGAFTTAMQMNEATERILMESNRLRSKK